MWRWRRKILHKPRRKIFWAKLLLVSLVGHAFLLFLLLFAYKGHNFSYNITISRAIVRSGAPVVFLPWCKSIKQASVSGARKNVVHKPVIKKVAATKKKTTISAPIPKKKVAKKTPPKKPASKKNPTKVVQKKKPVPKKKEEKKQQVAKKTPSKKILPQKVEQKPKHSVNKEKQVVATSGQQERAPIYVGRVEMEAMRMQDEMQTQVHKNWKPPVGLSKDLVCVLKVLVDWSGRAQETLVESSSGVLMYDIAARTAVARMQLPRWAYGKEFSITFKQ